MVEPIVFSTSAPAQTYKMTPVSFVSFWLFTSAGKLWYATLVVVSVEFGRALMGGKKPAAILKSTYLQVAERM